MAKPGLLFFFSVLLWIPLVLGDLQVGFYTSSCPQAESIIQSVVQKRFSTDPSVPAALLRMYFHDCFVRGCDASILIDSTRRKRSEKAAGPNLTLRGFDIIDEAKRNLEARCPSTVSCADVIAVATRDAVALAGGPSYDVPTGRRDGLVSSITDVDLPSSRSSVSEALQSFAEKGLSLEDMVVLLGGHTVGVAHCVFFRDRLFDAEGGEANGPAMDPLLRTRLAATCGATPRQDINKDPTAFLDQNTSFVIDNAYYGQLMINRGILQIDQELAVDNATAGMVAGFAKVDGDGFLQKFAAAMVKLGRVGVRVGSAGEIRRNCRVFNPRAPAAHA